MNATNTHLFYCFDGPTTLPRLPLPGGDDARWWQPGLTTICPRGFATLPFAVWWGFHHLRVFSNRQYALLAVYRAGQLVHRTCVFPRYFRFPFMQPGDLQIGDVWTCPTHRGQGLGAWALHEAMRQFGSAPRRLWYLVDEQNTASIRLAEKCGLVLCGRGRRLPRCGLQLLGAYHLTDRSQPVIRQPAQAA